MFFYFFIQFVNVIMCNLRLGNVPNWPLGKGRPGQGHGRSFILISIHANQRSGPEQSWWEEIGFKVNWLFNKLLNSFSGPGINISDFLLMENKWFIILFPMVQLK